MTFQTLIRNFMQGVGSVFSRAGSLKEMLSDIIADGVESGVQRLMPLLMKWVLISALMVSGIALLAFGFGKWADSLVATPGVGFVGVGIAFLIIGWFWFSTKQ